MNEVVGGIYSPQPLPSRWQRLLAMGASDSQYAPFGARLLGFRAVDHWRHLSFCYTGQSK
jgi:hypothetical protein